MNITIERTNEKQVEIAIPASKSLSHRALIAAALSKCDTTIHHLVDNQDTQATISAMQHLGADFERKTDCLVVHAMQKDKMDDAVVDCNESGSTLRFMIPLFSVYRQESCFTGHGRLMERPQSVYETVYHQKNLVFEKEGEILRCGGYLPSGNYEVNGNVSSQFITGLLCALPLVDGDSTLTVLPPYESQSYVGLTLNTLRKAGIIIEEEGNTYHIPGNQTYALQEITVPGDDSQAVFFGALGMMRQTPITISNVEHDSPQGDHVFLQQIASMGGKIEETADVYRFYPSSLHGTTIDLADCPDLGPMMFALATQAEGRTTFLHAGRLRVKESDRIACMEEELRKLGCDIYSEDDTVYVNGKSTIKGNVTLDGHNDHRIVMALSVLATIAKAPVTIQGAQAIAKSYPTFFEDLSKTGVQITYDSK